MLRSVILILITFAVLGGAFAIYELAQSPAAKRPFRTLDSATRPVKAMSGENMRGLGGGDDVWMKRYDTKTGELASQFKGQKYEPRNDNTVDVTNPQAEFFSKDGQQRIRIEGDRGNVIMRLGPKSKSGAMQAGEMGMPSRGKLHDVVISIFEPVDAASPQLVARMENAAFDMDTFRINTEAYTDASGHRVEADEVPVTVRGIDYDFDGKGLVIRWNERDSKLQLLEIAHGQSLVIKHPSSLTNGSMKPTSRPAATLPSDTDATETDATSILPVGWNQMLASADPSAPRLILTASKKKPVSAAARRRRKRHASTAPATRPKISRILTPIVYEATFEDNVNIFEADQQVAKLDRMIIDLLQQSSHDALQSQPQSTGATSTSSRTTGGTSHHSKKQPATSRASGTAAAASAPQGDAAATQNTNETGLAADDTGARGPITVKWTGKLRIVPLETKPDPALVAGKAIVHMIGSPAILTRDETKAVCASAVYNSADGSATLNSSTALPIVTLTDARGSIVKTPHLDYGLNQAGQHVATLIGQSEATMPIEGSSTPQLLSARWNNRCTVVMTQYGSSQTIISHADLLGDVRVNHPQLDLITDALTLNFDAPSANRDAATASLHDIVATGNVDCHIKDPQDQRTIKTQRLLVETAVADSGQTYAKYLQADGDVQTDDNGKELRAGHLEARLAPTTRPTTRMTTEPANLPSAAASAPMAPSSQPFAGGNIRLLSMMAEHNVRLTTPEGTRADADRLTVQGEGPQQTYVLVGKPAATVTDGKTIISGPTIRFDPSKNLAQISGAGKMHGVDPKNPNQNVDIAWQGGAIVNGATDWIDVDQGVVVNSVEADGTKNIATAAHLRAKLMPRVPTTQASSGLSSQPTSQPATRMFASSAPVKKSPDESMSFMKDKDITLITLTGNVDVKSETTLVDGSVARGMLLQAQTVTYDRLTGRMNVPVEGEMFYQDHRARTGDATTRQSPAGGGASGETAFKWSKSLDYDQSRRQVVMSGNVRVVHHADDAAGQPFDLTGQTLTADLQADRSEPSRPATQTAASAIATTASSRASSTASSTIEPSEKMRLKHLIIEGDVHVASSRLDVDANMISYDPESDVLIATGTDEQPVVVMDHNTGSRSQASKLEWNTRTDDIKLTNFTGKIRR